MRQFVVGDSVSVGDFVMAYTLEARAAVRFLEQATIVSLTQLFGGVNRASYYTSLSFCRKDRGKTVRVLLLGRAYET